MYNWRRMTPQERQQTLEDRKAKYRPWHSPPHMEGPGQYLLSTACFNHEPHIAYTAERLDHFSDMLLTSLSSHAAKIFAWCVLPDHYHVLVHTDDLKALLHSLAQLHGSMSYYWNNEEGKRGRQVWCSCADRKMRSYGHLMASINYVHHNPVKHGYVPHWQDWLWSSAHEFLSQMGREFALEMWRRYPIRDYGKTWDD